MTLENLQGIDTCCDLCGQMQYGRLHQKVYQSPKSFRIAVTEGLHQDYVEDIEHTLGWAYTELKLSTDIHTYKVETVVDIFSKVSGLFYAVSQVQLFFLSSFLTYYATK